MTEPITVTSNVIDENGDLEPAEFDKDSQVIAIPEDDSEIVIILEFGQN